MVFDPNLPIVPEGGLFNPQRDQTLVGRRNSYYGISTNLPAVRAPTISRLPPETYDLTNRYIDDSDKSINYLKPGVNSFFTPVSSNLPPPIPPTVLTTQPSNESFASTPLFQFKGPQVLYYDWPAVADRDSYEQPRGIEQEFIPQSGFSDSRAEVRLVEFDTNTQRTGTSANPITRGKEADTLELPLAVGVRQSKVSPDPDLSAIVSFIGYKPAVQSKLSEELTEAATTQEVVTTISESAINSDRSMVRHTDLVRSGFNL
jgi:hypothetical protein